MLHVGAVIDRPKASLVQREVAFSSENDGGIVMGRYRTIPQSFCFAKIQPPLHKGALYGGTKAPPYGVAVCALHS